MNFTRESFRFVLGKHLASPYFIAGTLAFGLLVHFSLASDVHPGHLYQRIFDVAVSTAVLLLLLNLAQLITRRFQLPHRPELVIAYFMFAGAVRGAVMESLLGAQGLVDSTGYLYRIFVGAFNFGVSAWTLAILMGAMLEFNRQTQQLKNDREYLDHLQITVDGQISTNTEIEINAFREFLLTNLKVNAATDADLVRKHLHHVIADVIRPVVEQMLANRTSVEMSEPTQAIASVNISRIFRRVRVSESFWPLVQGSFAVLPTFATNVLGFGFLTGLLITLAMLATWIILLLLAKTLIGTRADNLDYRLQLLIIGLIFSVAVTPSAIIANQFPVGTGGASLTGLSYAYALTAGYGMALWAAYMNELGAIYVERARYLQLIKWKIAEVNSRSWHQQLHFARRVHGALQSEVAALAIRLDREISKGKADEALLADLRTKLEERVRVVFDAPEAITDLGDVLAEIAETWDGVCQISVALTDGDAKDILRDQVAVETALEVVREGISNAVRHGKAKNVEVSVELIEANIVRVRVANDGSLFDASLVATGRQGIGSMHLKDCAIDYSIAPTENRTVLLADLPFRG